MRKFILVLAILLGALQYKLWFGEGNLLEVRHLQKEIVLQREKNERLKNNDRVLSAEVKALKTQGSAIGELARNRLGMIRRGGTFFEYLAAKPAQSKIAK